MPKRDIVVMGASAGGVAALREVLGALPAELPAAVFVTIHTAPSSEGYLAQVLGARCQLPVELARDEEPIRPGRVYVAPPNLHLLVKRGYVRVRFLPKENGSRPAIDPMFRSAAHSYSRRVIGVLLTGELDDGAAGLGIVRDEGGFSIVQDPRDARHPNMPLAALRGGEPDLVLPLREIAPRLAQLVTTEVSEQAPTVEEEVQQSAEVMTCPGCGGVLHQYADERKVVWYQCRVGHRFSSESMIKQQDVTVEEHLWRTLAILKEKGDTARAMAADARSLVRPPVDPEYYDAQARAAVAAQERVEAILDELGPALFPALPEKDQSVPPAQAAKKKRA